MAFSDDVGLLLKKIRLEKGMKAKDVADAANIAQSSLSYIENGTSSPSIKTLEAICNALGITLTALLIESTSPTEENTERTYDEKIKSLPEQAKKIIDTVIEVNQPDREKMATTEGK